MIKLITMILAILFASSNVIASGPTLTGSEIYPVCSKKNDNCTTYINGWLGGYDFGTMILANELGAQGTRVYYCFPDEINIVQLTDVFTQYLAHNSKERHYPAKDLVFMAFIDAFPCK